MLVQDASGSDSFTNFTMATKQAGRQANREAITLKGSSALVTEFFKFAANTYGMSSQFGPAY